MVVRQFVRLAAKIKVIAYGLQHLAKEETYELVDPCLCLNKCILAFPLCQGDFEYTKPG